MNPAVAFVGVVLWLFSQWAVIRWFKIPSQFERSMAVMTAALNELAYTADQLVLVFHKMTDGIDEFKAALGYVDD